MFVNEPGIRERYERYIARSVIDGTINYTPISFDAVHSVCALPELSKNTGLFNLLYTLNEKTRGHRSHYLCGRAYYMFNFITIIKPTILPSIRVARDGLFFSEPKAIPLI